MSCVGNGRYAGSTSILHLQDALDDGHLSVAAHVLHAVTPDNLAVLEQELAADLEQVATLELRGALLLRHGCPLAHLPFCERNVFHVFRSLGSGHVESDGHAQGFVEFATGFGEDGEWTAGGLLVEGDHGWRAAANDDDIRGNSHGVVSLHGDLFGDGFHVSLASAAVKVSHEDDELPVTNGIQTSEEGAEESRVTIGIVHGNLSGDSELSSVRTLVRDV